MRRFEYQDAKSHKFWEIEIEGDAFTVRYGKFGTDGQVQTKTFASDDKAQAEAEKVIRSKTKKGYAEVELDAKAHAQAKAKTAAAGARNLDLEAAILANPDDLGAWQVYFDWLQSEGDVWGERGNLAVARDRAKGPAKAKLTKQIDDFDQQHGEALYGKSLLGLMKKSDFAEVAELSDRYGLIMTAVVKSPEYEWPGTAPNTILGALVKSSAARLLSKLNIGLTEWDYPISLQKAVDAISKAGKLDSLRDLFIGDFEFPEEQEISWVEVGKVGKLLPIAPHLRSLALRGGGIDLGKLEHDCLESLRIETGGLPKAAVASVGKCRLPALTHMEVWFGNTEYGGNGNIRQLADLFTGKGVPKLVHLGLKNCDWEDEIAVALSKSDLLAQLVSVDLSMGTLHGAGVEAILANADKFQHLERLDLSENFLTEPLCERLREVFGERVNLGGQNQPSDWGDGVDRYYTSVGE